MKKNFAFAVALLLTIVFLVAVPSWAQNPSTSVTLAELKWWEGILDRLTGDTASAVEALQGEAALEPTRVATPARSRSAAVKLESQKDEGFPKAILYFPRGARVRPSRGEKLEPVLQAREELGEVLILQTYTRVAPTVSSNGPARLVSRKSPRVHLGAGDEVSLGEHSFSFEENGVYLLQVAIISMDPANRKQIADLYHLVLVERYNQDEVNGGLRIVFRLYGAFANPGFAGGPPTITAIGSFIPPDLEATEGMRQFIFVPGVGEMRFSAKDGQAATLPLRGNFPGWHDVVYGAVDRYGRATFFTLNNLLVEPPLFPNR